MDEPIKAVERKRDMRKVTKILLVCGALVFCGIGFFVYRLTVSQVVLPKDPAIEKISMTESKGKWPVSPVLLAYAKAKHTALLQKTVKQARPWLLKNNQWQWPKPAKFRALLLPAEPSLKALQAVFQQQGCHRIAALPKSADKLPSVSHFWLIHGAKALRLKAIALTQEGKANEAAALLGDALKWMQSVEANCPFSLVSAMMSVAVTDILTEAMFYPWASPVLSEQARRGLLSLMKKHAKRTARPLIESFRREFLFGAVLMRTLHKSSKDKKDRHMTLWPWWDAEQTISWSRRSFQSINYRLSQPYHKGYWTSTASDKFLEQIAKSTSAWSVLQYNGVGRVLFSVARPAFMKFGHKFHQSRCLAAARHAQMLRWYKKQFPDKAALQPELKSPLTLQPFDALSKALCAVRHPKTKRVKMKAKRLSRLPKVLAAVPNPAQPTPHNIPKK